VERLRPADNGGLPSRAWFHRSGGLLDLRGEIDFVLEVGGRDFRSHPARREQKPNLVRQPIDHLRSLSAAGEETDYTSVRDPRCRARAH
jgi:hypothetical protein